MLHTVFRRLSSTQFTLLVSCLAVGTAAINVISLSVARELSAWWGSNVAGKRFQFSFLPWIFMSLLGVPVQPTSTQLIPTLLNNSRQTLAFYLAALLVKFYIWDLP
jgi:hypothetical protein